jgi:hypothetical protein
VLTENQKQNQTKKSNLATASSGVSDFLGLGSRGNYSEPGATALLHPAKPLKLKGLRLF